MNNKKNLTLSEAITSILKEMENVHYSSRTIGDYKAIYNKIQKLVESAGKEHLDEEMAQRFINSYNHVKTGKYRRSNINRSIQNLKTFIDTGTVDWSVQYRKKVIRELNVSVFSESRQSFILLLEEKNLKKRTIASYERMVYYFLLYCEGMGYRSLAEIRSADIITFIEELCRERYQPTTLDSPLAGLKLYLSQYDTTRHLVTSFPCHPKGKRDIIPVLTEDEYMKFKQYLMGEDISRRNAAICLLAFETGLRAVDICKLKKNNIDWKNDCIHIIQQKTSKTLELPLRSTYGNILADYFLYERPESDSPFVFLTSRAPFSPLRAIHDHILYNAFRDAGILKPERSNGTRLTRHNAASYMLKRGVPLPDISLALGHTDPNSVDIYLTTDEKILSECTLPMPSLYKKEVSHDE